MNDIRRIYKSLYMLAELVVRFSISPYLRSFLLKILGATIGSNVRIYEVRFINLEKGFSNLVVGDDVHIGTGCIIDLEGKVIVGRGATISPNVTILSHSDPGSSHSSPLCKVFPEKIEDVNIGSYCWVGASSTILCGSIIPDRTVVGAGSLVCGALESGMLYYGVPARKIKSIINTSG